MQPVDIKPGIILTSKLLQIIQWKETGRQERAVVVTVTARTYKSLADPGGAAGAPPQQDPILSFSHMFGRNTHVSELGAPPPTGRRPPQRKILDPPLQVIASWRTHFQPQGHLCLQIITIEGSIIHFICCLNSHCFSAAVPIRSVPYEQKLQCFAWVWYV